MQLLIVLLVKESFTKIGQDHVSSIQYCSIPLVNDRFWCAGRINTTTVSGVGVDNSHAEKPSATPCNLILGPMPIMGSTNGTFLSSNGASALDAATLHPASRKAVTPVQAEKQISGSHQVAIWQPRPTALVCPHQHQCHLEDTNTQVAIYRYPIISLEKHACVDQTMDQILPTPNSLKISIDMVRCLTFSWLVLQGSAILHALMICPVLHRAAIVCNTWLHWMCSVYSCHCSFACCRCCR